MEMLEILQGLSTLLFALSMFILNGFKNSIDDTKDSISELNANIATLLANDANKTERLDRMDAEINNIRSNLHELRNETNATFLNMERKIIERS